MPKLNLLGKLDTLLVLFIYAFAPLFFISLLALILALVLNVPLLVNETMFMVAAVASSFALFIPMVSAAIHDRQPQVLAAMPYLPITGFINLFATSVGFFSMIMHAWRGSVMQWDKTKRYEQKGVKP